MEKMHNKLIDTLIDNHKYALLFNDTATTENETLTRSFPTRRSSDLLGSARQSGRRCTSPPLPHATTRRNPVGNWRVNQNFPFGCQMRSEEHTSELQSLMRTSYAVFCFKKKK